MKLSKDRPKTLDLPTEIWYYATPWTEDDREKLWTEEQYAELRQREPMLYRSSYEEYVKGYESRQQEMFEYTAQKAVVTRDTVDDVYEKITKLPEFVGWLVTSDSTLE